MTPVLVEIWEHRRFTANSRGGTGSPFIFMGVVCGGEVHWTNQSQELARVDGFGRKCPSKNWHQGRQSVGSWSVFVGERVGHLCRFGGRIASQTTMPDIIQLMVNKGARKLAISRGTVFMLICDGCETTLESAVVRSDPADCAGHMSRTRGADGWNHDRLFWGSFQTVQARASYPWKIPSYPLRHTKHIYHTIHNIS